MKYFRPAAVFIATLLACFFSPCAWADQDSPNGTVDAASAIPKVEVPANLDGRDEKSYRRILDGMNVFENHHALAPGATLRFKVMQREAGVNLHGLTLQIRAEHLKIAIPLDKNLVFELPRNIDAAKADAVVISNRRAKSLTWRAEIRTPGIPANTRRLGDLLLECKVGMAADLVAYVATPLNVMVTKMADPCRSLPINMFFFTDRPLFSVTLVYGKRRTVLPQSYLHGPALPVLASLQDWSFLRDRAFMLQFKSLFDQGWPVDTLLQFDYMDDDPVATGELAQPAGAIR